LNEEIIDEEVERFFTLNFDAIIFKDGKKEQYATSLG